MASGPFSFLLISAPSWAHQWTQTTAAIFSWTCWPAGGSVGATHFQQVRFRVTYGLYTTDCRLARVAPTTAIGGQQLANLFKKSIPSTLPISSQPWTFAPSCKRKNRIRNKKVVVQAALLCTCPSTGWLLSPHYCHRVWNAESATKSRSSALICFSSTVLICDVCPMV